MNIYKSFVFSAPHIFSTALLSGALVVCMVCGHPSPITHPSIHPTCSFDCSQLSVESLVSQKRLQRVIRESVDISRESVDVSRESVDVSRESVDVSRESVEVSRESVEVSRELVDVSRESVEVSRDSIVSRESVEVSE